MNRKYEKKEDFDQWSKNDEIFIKSAKENIRLNKKQFRIQNYMKSK